MNAPHPDFRPRYEPAAEVDALRLEVERLRDFVETRAQMQERMLRAMLNESQGRVAEMLEPRIQLAAAEAMAYAEGRLERQESTLRALGRRFADFARETPSQAPEQPPARAVADYAIGVGEAQGATQILLSEDSEDAWLRDAAHLAIPPCGASRLVATHVIEHIAPTALETRVLPHWRSRLAQGGELVVVTLDGPTLLSDLAASADFTACRERLFSAGARSLRNLLDASTLDAMLRRAGFTPSRVSLTGSTLRVVARL